jgi:putative sterol carrier protein
LTFAEILTGVREKVASSQLEGTSVYQFSLSGDEGGDFYVQVADGKGQVKEGVAEEPDVTVSMTDQVFKALAAGKMSATSAFFAGKIKLKGDMSLAMKLQSFLG